MLGGGVPFLTDWSGKTFPEVTTFTQRTPGEKKQVARLSGDEAFLKGTQPV